MKEPAFEKLDQLVNQAKLALAESQAIMQESLDDSNFMPPSDGSSMDGVQVLQLILQYRMDTQDALIKLLQLDHGLLQILGIGPQQSIQMNIERMEFALGNDDLHHILYALGQLVHSLLKVAQRYQQNLDKQSKKKQNQQTLKTSTFPKKFERLQQAVIKQKLFIALITEINGNYDAWIKYQALGPVHDHIAALRGPVSQFFQALQNGFETTHHLYEQTNTGVKLDHTLSTLIKQTELVLKHIPPIYQPQHFFTPAKADTTTEQLEQRAAIKRLGHFFRYDTPRT